MTSTSSPAVDSEVPELLRRLLQQFRAGDLAGQECGLNAIGAAQLAANETVVGALCLGGTDFAAWLVAYGRGTLSSAEGYAAVAEAFSAVYDVPPGAPDDHETRVTEGLIRRFGLSVSPQALFDRVRAEFQITAGPLKAVPKAALWAVEHAQWELALRGFIRCEQSLQENAPRSVFGMAAMCLHKLGRYVEADHWVERGLGPLKALIAIPAVRSEAELVQQWSCRTEPVVSILCTTYNHERYIDSAIRGFLSQDCPFPFEILIHDDASSDGTPQRVRHWQQQYPNVIKSVLQTENQFSKGVRPFELLLARARGEFVATCEGDDFWVDSSKLGQQVGFLKSHPEFACSAHNYYHFQETTLSVTPWIKTRVDRVFSQRQLMGLSRLLWLPTLVFRKTFSTMPPERALAPIGDQFLTSYLGTLRPCMYFESLMGAVRRENEFSTWSPLPDLEKERIRVKTWQALVRLHERMGNPLAVADLTTKISASPLSKEDKLAGFDPAPGWPTSSTLAVS